jgi:hypothetical protein
LVELEPAKFLPPTVVGRLGHPIDRMGVGHRRPLSLTQPRT